MNVEVFSLCDAATIDQGKLNMLGAFDIIWASNFPVIHPQCAIALRIRFVSSEKGDHAIVVNFVDADGKNIIPPAKGVIKVNFPDGQMSSSANLILNIQGLKLPNEGQYSINLAVDGSDKASLPLLVKKHG